MELLAGALPARQNVKEFQIEAAFANPSRRSKYFCLCFCGLLRTTKRGSAMHRVTSIHKFGPSVTPHLHGRLCFCEME